MKPNKTYMHKTSIDGTRCIDGVLVTLPIRVLNRIDPRQGHWIWNGALTPSGYGSISWNGKHRPAHRFIYERLVAPVPDHLDMDHLCRIRECVNPAHLEPVPQRINMLRGVAPAANAVRTNRCLRGHEYTPENTRWSAGGTERKCRQCQAIAGAKRKQKMREQRHERGLLPDAGAINSAKTHCPRGHEYTAGNTSRNKHGHRHCIQCRRDQAKTRYWKTKENNK